MICPYLLLAAFFLFAQGASGQNVTKAEYFLDEDPGFGLGTDVPVVPSANISNLQFSIGLGSVSYGFHTLFVRAKDENGHWSLSKVSPFYRSELNTAALPNIVKAEYFMDADPGFGQGTDILLTPSTNISNLQFTISLGSVALGFHTLYIRAKDANGHWSFSQVKGFYKLALNTLQPNVTKVEYFLDNDPGYGLGTNIPVTPSLNISNLQFNVGLGSVPAGFHTLYVRAKDGNGHWSMTQVRTFYNLAVNSSPLPNITRVEYFLDNDPGFGLGTNIPVTPATTISNLQFPINLASVAEGFHMLYVRAKDMNGKWSLSEVRSFYKTAISPSVLPEISKVEYFIDSDPGFGMGTDIPVVPSTNISNLQFVVGLSNVPVGFHTLYIRAKDGNGRWSLSQVKPFYKTSLPAALPPVTKVEYFFDTDPGMGLGTNVPVTPSTNINNLSFTIDVSTLPVGTHRLWLRAKDVNGEWSHVTWDTVIQVNLYVGVSIAASGNGVCSGTPVTFTASPVNGGGNPSYQWKVNGANAGSNSPVFMYTPANADAVICVLTSSLSNVVGNPATSNVVTMSVGPAVPASVIITASANPVCPGTPVAFSATPANGGAGPAYQWKVNGVNAGTNSAQYTFTPAVADIVTCVMTSNASCVSGNPATSNQVVISGLSLNATVTGASSVCTGAGSVPYSTETGMTGYNWIVSSGGQIVSGNGTNTINVIWSTTGSKTVTVTYGNGTGCVTQVPGLLNVTVSGVPPAAGIINGPTRMCVGTQGVTYSIPAVQGATGYQWTVPPGVVIVSGAGTNSITVNYPLTALSGNIIVSAINTCGIGPPSPQLPVSSNNLLSGQLNLTNISVKAMETYCQAAGTITTAGGGTTFQVQYRGAATLIASQSVTMLPGTTVYSGGTLHAYITTQCESCTALKGMIAESMLPDGSDAEIAMSADASETAIRVYPNPTPGSFVLDLPGEMQKDRIVAELYSARGNKLLSKRLPDGPKHMFTLAGYPAGIYFLRVITRAGVKTIKVIHQ